MRLLIFTTITFIALHSTAQNHFCGSTEAQNAWFTLHPELKAKYDAHQRQAEADDKAFSTHQNAQQRTSSVTSAASFTIPMVFHILHTGGSENISDAQILDAVSIVNRDYRKLNADTSSVVSAFKSLIGDAKIEFHLATRDPNGNCTNGILRHWDTNTDWPQNNNGDYIYTWDPTMYLNVYVVKTMTGGFAGYTYVPGSGVSPSMDAVVILSTYIGSIGTGNVFTSRALTHEIGHWFNLQHPWGGTNQPGVACGDDGVSDTPITKGFSACNLNNASICTPGIIENMQNYMDYAYCARMFTLGQVNRMQTAAGDPQNGRNNLSTTSNLTNTGLLNPLSNCSPVVDLSSPTTLACSGHSVTVISYTANANPSTYSWAADNGATVLNPSANNASVLFNNPGLTTVTCTVSNTYGSDSKSLSFNILNGVTDVTVTHFEGFEAATLPANWTVYNATTPTVKWEITPDGAESGNNSIFLAGENLPADAIEILETPSYDFKNNPGAQFTFYYAYARASYSNKDIFKVQASKNCDGIWKDVWYTSNQELADSSVGIMSATFYAGNDGWVLHNLVNDPRFQTFLYEDNVRIRFYFQEDPGGAGFGNRIYLDDIDFTGLVGINELSRASNFNIYPNPSASTFNMDFTLAQPAAISYKVVSVTGVTLINSGAKTMSEGFHQVKLNENGQLSKGIYFLNFEMNGASVNRKLVVN